MEISLKNTGAVTVVAIEGSVDSLTADRLTESFEAQISGGNVRLVADFSAVSYTSSAGLRSLLGAVKDARQKGGDLRIAAVQPQVQRVLSLSGFTSIIRVFDSVAVAVDSFGPTA